MQKRVAIARAIALNPKYLFCDEPNSGLDPKTAILIDNLIQEITQEFNMTTIVNTHDMNSVMEIGDKVMFIYHGEKWWEGTNNDIFDSENKELNDFIFASKLSQKIRDLKNGDHPNS
jgi:phospholipid/cholesterol/gamma-HCH transport system ATP-binding protein